MACRPRRFSGGLEPGRELAALARRVNPGIARVVSAVSLKSVRSRSRVATLTAVLILATLPLTGCSFFEAPPQPRGNRVDAEQLRELTPGTSTRADVTALIGSPTVRAPFDDNTWIYISETTQSRVGRMPAVLAQEVVVLTFREDGVLREIDKKTKDDSMPVDVVSRTTPSPGTEASFLQQLFGNIGRFNTISSSQTSGGGGIGGASGGAPRPY